MRHVIRKGEEYRVEGRIIIFIYLSNVHRDTSSVDYITITYNYNN